MLRGVFLDFNSVWPNYFFRHRSFVSCVALSLRRQDEAQVLIGKVLVVIKNIIGSFANDSGSFTRMSSCSVCMSFVRLGHHDG